MGQKKEKSIDCNNVLKNKNVIASNIRVCIYPKDVQRITGNTDRQGCICTRSKPT